MCHDGTVSDVSDSEWMYETVTDSDLKEKVSTRVDFSIYETVKIIIKYNLIFIKI